ncbi:MAG: DNA-binding transcriptional LysR family regulator [Myxococcota bacterium]|jgi:DNA-binding transcriptional LysR family regulator
MTYNHEVMHTIHSLAELDLNLLVAFAALADEGSVTRAARRLGISQSATSHTLRRLRDALGDPLLVRSGQGMALTPRGAQLVVPVRRALADLERALASPEAFDPASAQHTLRMASIDLFDVLVLPHVARRLRTEAPGVCLVSAPGAQVERDLATGDLDLAVVARIGDHHDAPLPNALVQRTLIQDGFSCFYRSDHPLFSAGPPTLEGYLAAPHLLVSPTGRGQGLVDSVLAEAGHTRRITVRLPAFFAALSIVRETDLVLTAPTALRRTMPNDPAIRCAPPPIAVPPHRLLMVWHARFTEDPGHQWFRDVLAEAAGAVAGAGQPTAASPRLG